MEMTHWLQYLMPWEFSWAWVLLCLGMATVYFRGLLALKRNGAALPAWWRSLAFYAGLALVYLVSHTYYDYLSQFLFFAHRAQHLVLHHLGPMLIAFAAPIPVLAAGVPARIKVQSIWPRVQMVLAPLYALVQQPVIASILFVGIIFFWLNPAVHYYAMLSPTLYQIMNWSMLLEGLLFWFLIFDRRTSAEGGLKWRWRFASLVAIAPPQIGLGAIIVFSRTELFDVYSVCGRAWAISPMTDQQLGGLLTWIPPAMMSLIGVLIIAKFAMDDARFQDSETAKPNSVYAT